MSQYLILIYEDEAYYASASPEQLGRDPGRPTPASPSRSVSSGATMLGGNALQPTVTATSIRDDVVTDGPFAETKEALGGYYLIEASDLDQALAVAKLCPAGAGGVEVRPIWTPPPWAAEPAPEGVTSRTTRQQRAARAPRSGLPCRRPTARSGRSSSRRPHGRRATWTWPRSAPRRPSAWPWCPGLRDGIPRSPGCVAHDHGPAPGHRPAAPGPDPARQAAAADRPRDRHVVRRAGAGPTGPARGWPSR